jgi:branched-chain amino acid transport system substrate-binding protein
MPPLGDDLEMMGRRVAYWVLLLVLLGSLLLAACQSGSAKLAQVYVSLPLRGPGGTTSIGERIKRGIQLAFDEVGNQVGNTQINVVYLDDGNEIGQWEIAKEEENAQKAIDDGAVAYIGPYNSGAAKQSIPILNRAGLLQISPSATWPGLTKPGFAQGEPGIFYPTGQRTFFRTTPTDDAQAPAAALWARSLGLRTYYILDDGEAYGIGIANLFSRYAQQIGLYKLAQQTIDKTATDYSAILEAVKKADPDLVYFGGTVANGAPRLLKQMREMGIDAACMGPDALMDPSLIEMAGPAAEGVYVTFVGVPPEQLKTDRAQSFVANYEKANQNETPASFEAYGYDAGLAVIAAIAQADRTNTLNRAGVLAAMQTLPDLEGVNGTYDFDRNGDNAAFRSVSGSVVQNGVFSFVQALNAP